MGFFDRFDKLAEPDEPAEPLFNAPHLLSVKLLFESKPTLDVPALLAGLRQHYRQVDHPPGEHTLLFFFPELEVEFADAKVPAQCSILFPNDQQEPTAEIAPEAFQQSWQWPGAEEAAGRCRYEILLTDFMTRALPYADRVALFMNFLAAAVEAANPQAVYTAEAQLLLEPASVTQAWDGPRKQALAALVNVRLYNISDGAPGETVMDTLGLYLLGLPDFQVRSTGLSPGEVAGLLWNYAYYIFQNGDVMEDGATIAGLEPGSRWHCARQLALVGPERMVLDVRPS